MYFQVLVQRLDDIMDVEPHKLVIIFVDFNNRNIILENEDAEIGDLRNQTTKMFLSLKCKYCHQWRREISCITSCLCLMLMKFLIWYVYHRDGKQLFNVGNLVYVGSGDVLVVYCKDKGSQDLPPENLYNPRLHSIERHPVLSELKNKKRVLSINDKFHPHQVEHLKSCCQQL